MTEHRTPTCHYDRRLGERIVTGAHRDDCPIHDNHPEDCPGTSHRGCAPCTAPHCVLCRTRHNDNDHPVTCPTCIGRVRTDLHDVLWYCRHLRWQATRGGQEGHLIAAGRIPGGDALVLYARAGAFGENMRYDPSKGITAETLDEVHHPRDVVPVLLPLASWAIAWRRYFGHDLAAKASVSGIVHYLTYTDRLGRMAQAKDGPDWTAFAWDIGALVRQLEQVLHDESEPEQGVSCFECNQRLVRRFGKPDPCKHMTPARRWLLKDLPRQRAAAQSRLAVLRTYPELGEPTDRDLAAARRLPTSAEESAARVPCADCVKTGQGGIENPSVGQSWECIGCRRKYSPGEYAQAVRSDLQTRGPGGDGWTFVNMAADAASTQTGLVIAQSTVRKWLDTGKVAGICRWTPKVTWGQRMVFWPDVADRAAEMVARHLAAEEERRFRQAQARRFYAALQSKKITKVPAAVKLGKEMGIHPNRVRAFLNELEAAVAGGEKIGA